MSGGNIAENAMDCMYCLCTLHQWVMPTMCLISRSESKEPVHLVGKILLWTQIKIQDFPYSQRYLY